MEASSAGNTIQNMYNVDYDPRIIMTPVLSCDSKTRTFICATHREERVFGNEQELIRHLVYYTETNGYSDPSRWSNSLISRQLLKGKSARTPIVQEGWYASRIWRRQSEEENSPIYWFHDVHGRTLDVRNFLPKIIEAVRNGNPADTSPFTWNRWVRQGRKSHNGPRRRRHNSRRNGGIGAYLRSVEREDFYDEQGILLYQWIPRGKLVYTASVISDFDWKYESLGCHSRGWKAHKNRHQWEHRVREQEKHQRNRARKENLR